MGKPPTSGPYKGMGGFQFLGNLLVNKKRYGTIKAPAGVKPLNTMGIIKSLAKAPAKAFNVTRQKPNQSMGQTIGKASLTSSGVNTEVQNDDVITSARARL